ncbi:MAG: hypothetical protein CMI29_06665 [Opitutae bacterium]|nr:hypothetical protein [Opitutae bacterium]|tara:strand:+ start:207 stop:1031 length:825 start_codon:yes stop_codon:yes gene_type:complete
MSSSATEKLKPLTELCHDALAEGVIAKHDGLPESWLACFQKNGRVMEQLRVFALSSIKREAVPDSDTPVTILVLYPNNSLTKVDSWQMCASCLGEWQFALLCAYFQAVAWYKKEHLERNVYIPEHDPLGGYRIDWQVQDWKQIWNDLERWHGCVMGNDRYTQTYLELTHVLLDAFEIDVSQAYADDISRWEAAREDSEFFEDFDDRAIADFFPDTTRIVLCDALCERVGDTDYKRMWVWELEGKRDGLYEHYFDPSDRKFERASFCTLFFDLRE